MAILPSLFVSAIPADRRGSAVRLIYLGALFALTLGFLLFAVHTWQVTKGFFSAQLEHAGEHIAQSVTASLSHQEAMLYMLGDRFRQVDALASPEVARDIVEHAMSMNPSLAGFGLAAPDGQLVLVTGIPSGKALPNLMDRPASRTGFEQALNAPRMVIGQTYYFPLLKKWLIPVRLAFRDATGRTQLVMTAGINIDAAEALWNTVALPEGIRVTVWREDGYRQLSLPSAIDGRDVIYGEPRDAETAWSNGYPPQAGAMVDVTRDSRFNLSYVASIQNRDLRDDYLGRMALPTGVFLGGLFLVWVTFGYAKINQRRFDNALIHQATHDPLTQLPNRSLLEDRIQQDVARAARLKRHVAVMYVDLDRFKRINDSFGHKTGDRLLKACADRLTNDLRAGDTVGRLGGDEFLLVFPDLEHPSHAQGMAARVLNEFTRPFYLGGTEMFSTVSIGVAVYPEDGENSETLMQNADAALYEAKDSGRNSFRFFEKSQNEATLRRIALEQGLRHAIERRELHVVYQPQCDAETLEWRGAEALLRWTSAELGTVSPGEFIPVAEESGLIDELGWFVLETVMADALEIPQPSSFRFAVNVSVRQFRQTDFIHRLLGRLESNGVSPRLIELEVTESIMAESIPQLALLRDAGLRLAIDDFGTGFSSLSYLKRLPVTTLKLDQEFVRDLETDPADRTLITAMVAMARELQLETIAEGVETQGQLEILRNQGCAQVQGYLLGRPVPFSDLVRRRQTNHKI